MAAPGGKREGEDNQIDERFIDEWIEFGWSELVSYLTKWARFAELYPDPEREEAA